MNVSLSVILRHLVQQNEQMQSLGTPSLLWEQTQAHLSGTWLSAALPRPQGQHVTFIHLGSFAQCGTSIYFCSVAEHSHIFHLSPDFNLPEKQMYSTLITYKVSCHTRFTFLKINVIPLQVIIPSKR